MRAIETPRCKLVGRATGTRLGKVPGSSFVVSKEEPQMVFNSKKPPKLQILSVL